MVVGRGWGRRGQRGVGRCIAADVAWGSCRDDAANICCRAASHGEDGTGVCPAGVRWVRLVCLRCNVVKLHAWVAGSGQPTLLRCTTQVILHYSGAGHCCCQLGMPLLAAAERDRGGSVRQHRGASALT